MSLGAYACFCVAGCEAFGLVEVRLGITLPLYIDYKRVSSGCKIGSKTCSDLLLNCITKRHGTVHFMLICFIRELLSFIQISQPRRVIQVNVPSVEDCLAMGKVRGISLNLVIWLFYFMMMWCRHSSAK